VERPSEIAQENSNDLRKSLPQYENNIDVFREMDEGRTLLILGEPGAGKTALVLRIAKSLIADTEQNLSLPIPVIFNLSSWAKKRQSIAQWLIQELIKNYKVSKSLAQHWIQNQQLLLMLDGLDEVKAEYRDACVKVLNEFMQSYGETEIIVCSRVKDYESLFNRLAIQRGVCIQSLTTEQINDYLDRAGNQLQAVKTLLETDTALQELVKSPLMLSIITLAYKDVAVEDLPQFDSVEEHRQHLFNSYIQRMFARRGTNKLYPEEKARNWLNWLAYKMSQDSQTIFSIEQMQPRWLETGWQKFIYNIGVIVIYSLTTLGLYHFILLFIAILFPKHFKTIEYSL
jgi:adenylate kinase family enzyme